MSLQSLQGATDLTADDRKALSAISPTGGAAGGGSPHKLIPTGTFTFSPGPEMTRSASSLSDRLGMPTSPVKFTPLHPLFPQSDPNSGSKIPIRPGSSLRREPPVVNLDNLSSVVNPVVGMTHLMQVARQRNVEFTLSQLSPLEKKEKRSAICCLRMQDKSGRTALYHAIEAQDPSGALALIQFGIDMGGLIDLKNSGEGFINLPDREKRSPLLLAAYMGLDAVVEALIAHGAHHWVRDGNKVSLLHILAMRHHVELIRKLLAPPYSVSSWGEDCFGYRADDYGKMDWESICLLHPLVKGDRRKEEWPEIVGLKQTRPPTPWNPCLHA